MDANRSLMDISRSVSEEDEEMEQAESSLQSNQPLVAPVTTSATSERFKWVFKATPYVCSDEDDEEEQAESKSNQALVAPITTSVAAMNPGNCSVEIIKCDALHQMTLSEEVPSTSLVTSSSMYSVGEPIHATSSKLAPSSSMTKNVNFQEQEDSSGREMDTGEASCSSVHKTTPKKRGGYFHWKPYEEKLIQFATKYLEGNSGSAGLCFNCKVDNLLKHRWSYDLLDEFIQYSGIPPLEPTPSLKAVYEKLHGMNADKRNTETLKNALKKSKENPGCTGISNGDSCTKRAQKKDVGVAQQVMNQLFDKVEIFTDQGEIKNLVELKPESEYSLNADSLFLALLFGQAYQQDKEHKLPDTTYEVRREVRNLLKKYDPEAKLHSFLECLHELAKKLNGYMAEVKDIVKTPKMTPRELMKLISVILVLEYSLQVFNSANREAVENDLLKQIKNKESREIGSVVGKCSTIAQHFCKLYEWIDVNVQDVPLGIWQSIHEELRDPGFFAVVPETCFPNFESGFPLSVFEFVKMYTSMDDHEINRSPIAKECLSDFNNKVKVKMMKDIVMWLLVLKLETVLSHVKIEESSQRRFYHLTQKRYCILVSTGAITETNDVHLNEIVGTSMKAALKMLESRTKEYVPDYMLLNTNVGPSCMKILRHVIEERTKVSPTEMPTIKLESGATIGILDAYFKIIKHISRSKQQYPVEEEEGSLEAIQSYFRDQARHFQASSSLNLKNNEIEQLFKFTWRNEKTFDLIDFLVHIVTPK